MSYKHTEIGKRLAAIRKQHSLSQKEVGDKLGFPWRTYQTWEIGSRQINLEHMVSFCTFFEVRVEWMVTGTGPQDSYSTPQIASEIAFALAAEISKQDRALDPAACSLITSKMVGSYLRHGMLDIEELANYVELASHSQPQFNEA